MGHVRWPHLPGQPRIWWVVAVGLRMGRRESV
jgi:hypothetical protein